MDHRDNQQEMENHPTLPILPRLDRIDRLLQFVEERRHRCCCRRSPRAASNCSKLAEEETTSGNASISKSLSSAMEEVQNKGTLMERLEMLENRILQLWLEVDHEELNMSSSTVTSSAVLSKNENENESAAPKASTSTTTLHFDDDHGYEGLKKSNDKGRHYSRRLLRKKRWFHYPIMGC